jgi:putative glycosyltransferase (TIGR04372 family)
MGYYVFRMGSKVLKSFNTNHPKIFDYAANGMRTEFLDIFLGSQCYFCISTGTGWDSVPGLYRRPLVFVNLLPVGYYPTYFKNCIFQAKNHFSITENRYLTLSEIISKKICNFMSIKEFNDNSIELIENTPEEILSAGLEMLDLLNSNSFSPEEEHIQINFWKNFDFNLKSKTGLPLHGELNARHSLSFLKKYPHWLS